MTRQLSMPPRPEGMEWRQWAAHLVEWLRAGSQIKQETEPQAIQLAHQRDTGAFGFPRATQCGILMYDRVNGYVVHSCMGEFVEIINGNVVVRGAGSPEGVVTANPGTLYLNSAGGAGTTFYVKESGVGNTGWIGK